MIAIAIAWFLLGLLLLALGGDSIVKAVSGLAQRFGASPFTAGLLLLGVTTSLPELAVNARALAVGQPELALGNAVGSSIVNLGFTLAVAAIAAPLLLRARLQTVLWWSLLVAGVLLVLFGLDGRLARWEGGVLVAGFIVMQVLLLRRGRVERAEVQAAIAESALSRTSLPLNVLRVLIAALTLYWGARLVVGAAADFGAALGWTPLLVGLLPVAIGTALPEVATAIAAARRGHGDMVLGHVLGSSVVNLLLVIGAMAVLQPLALPASFVRLELPALPVLRGFLFPRRFRRRKLFLGSRLVARQAGTGFHQQRQRRLGHHVGADRRGDEQEYGDQQLARLRVLAQEDVVADRAHQHAAHAQRAGLGRRVQALEERGQLHQPQCADQDEEAAEQQQDRQADLYRGDHSTMSRRSTNLLSTTVLPKPSMAMTSAASK